MKKVPVTIATGQNFATDGKLGFVASFVIGCTKVIHRVMIVIRWIYKLEIDNESNIFRC